MSQFTKKAIMESAMRLLQDKPLDKITVKDIVEDCGINRGTFYYYFSDVYALVEAIFAEEVERITNSHDIYSSWQEAFLEATELARDSKRQLYHAYNSISRDKLEQYLTAIARHLLGQFVEQQSQGLEVAQADKDFLRDFYAFALVGLTLSWIGEGMKEDPSGYIRRMGGLLEGNIRSALERAGTRQP